MKKTSLVISSVVVAALSLVGCDSWVVGSEDNTPTQRNTTQYGIFKKKTDVPEDNTTTQRGTTTGTGYYVDSAVSGINYTCGSQSGITDKDGKFTFDQGKDCTFEVAGITLKKVQADNLVDNAKIVENNTTVARFLQSLDTDGDPNNGIQITDKIITILTKALKDESITAVPDTTAKLDTFIGHIIQEDTSYKGHVVTEEEAQTHLQSTQESVQKDLIAGKTFYVVGQKDSKINIVKFVVSTDGTESKIYNLDGQFERGDSITYNGNNIKFGSSDGYAVITPKNGYILGQDYLDNGSLEQGIGHRLYSTQSDAQKYYDSLNPAQDAVVTNPGVTATDLKTLFAGKTFYQPIILDNNSRDVVPVIFNEDATTIQVIPPEEDPSPITRSITIEDGKIVFLGDGDEDEMPIYIIDEVTDTYIKGHVSWLLEHSGVTVQGDTDSVTDMEETDRYTTSQFIFYVNKADATNATNSSYEVDNSNYEVDNSLSVEFSFIEGKKHDDGIRSYGGEIIATFNKKMKMLGWTSGNYSLKNGYWRSETEFVIDFESYMSGGVIKFKADGFVNTDNKVMSSDVSFTFP